MRIRITTDRLPQPERHKGAEIDVSDEKAASMIAQGFAEAVESAPAVVAAPTRRRRGEAAL
jgi:hypothetical protein